MKRIIFTLTTAISLLLVNSSMQAKRWFMHSNLDKPLLVQVELVASKNPYFVLVQPNGYADFDWTGGNAMAGFCLGKIKYVFPDQAMLNNSEIIKDNKVVDNNKMLNWLEEATNKAKYPRHETKLITSKSTSMSNSDIAPLVGVKGYTTTRTVENEEVAGGCTSRENIEISARKGEIVFISKI